MKTAHTKEVVHVPPHTGGSRGLVKKVKGGLRSSGSSDESVDDGSDSKFGLYLSIEGGLAICESCYPEMFSDDDNGRRRLNNNKGKARGGGDRALGKKKTKKSKTTEPEEEVGDDGIEMDDRIAQYYNLDDYVPWYEEYGFDWGGSHPLPDMSEYYGGGTGINSIDLGEASCYIDGESIAMSDVDPDVLMLNFQNCFISRESPFLF